MENKSFEEIIKHMHFLGIVDNDYAKELLSHKLPNDSTVICVTRTSHEDKIVDYIFSILKNDDGKFNVSDGLARMLIVPEIVHGFFDGIDTRELEKRFADVNWNKIYLPIAMNSNVIADLITLSKSKEAAAQEIAESLKVKYWANTPLDRIFIISSEMEKFEKTMSFPIRMDSNDVYDHQVYNLLNGRSVIKFDIQEGLQTKAYWVKEEKGELLTFSDFDLAGRLRELPFADRITDVKKLEMFYDLLDGNRVSTPIKIGDLVIPAILEADPANAKIAVYDMYRKPLDIENIKKQTEIKRIVPKPIRPVPRKPRKGKGL